MNQNTKNILEMGNGAFLELTDYEVTKAISNIRDVNTDPTAKRVIKIQVTLSPDGNRENIAVGFKVDSKLAPVNPAMTMLYVAGEGSVVEMTPQIPGQMGLNGSEQEAPPMLRLVE